MRRSERTIARYERSYYFMGVSRGEVTRQMILERALSLASKLGLDGVTIGHLASDLNLSKSGLFAHFQSKEALQLQLLDFAALRFVEIVIRPAMAAPAGEPRIRTMFDRWLAWPKPEALPGGCFFVAAATELDDRPGALRDRLVELQVRWLGVLAESARQAVAQGEFKPEIDGEQFAHDVYGIMLAYHHAARLLRDPRASSRARTAFESLLVASRRKAEPEHVEDAKTCPGDREPGLVLLLPERNGAS
jgi:AcrR family transcriptional regulator